MKQNTIKSTEKKSKDQVTKVNYRFTAKLIGSIFVALSGLVLLADKVILFELTNNYGFSDSKTFIWVFSQTLSPVLLIIAILFNPFKTSYLIPIYIYTVQMYWIFRPSIKFDDALLQTYALGTCLAFVFLFQIITKSKILQDKRDQENKEFISETKELLKTLKQ